MRRAYADIPTEGQMQANRFERFTVDYWRIMGYQIKNALKFIYDPESFKLSVPFELLQ
jgi:hypothetical protein